MHTGPRRDIAHRAHLAGAVGARRARDTRPGRNQTAALDRFTRTVDVGPARNAPPERSVTVGRGAAASRVVHARNTSRRRRVARQPGGAVGARHAGPLARRVRGARRRPGRRAARVGRRTLVARVAPAAVDERIARGAVRVASAAVARRARTLTVATHRPPHMSTDAIGRRTAPALAAGVHRAIRAVGARGRSSVRRPRVRRRTHAAVIARPPGVRRCIDTWLSAAVAPQSRVITGRIHRVHLAPVGASASPVGLRHSPRVLGAGRGAAAARRREPGRGDDRQPGDTARPAARPRAVRSCSCHAHGSSPTGSWSGTASGCPCGRARGNRCRRTADRPRRPGSRRPASPPSSSRRPLT